MTLKQLIEEANLLADEQYTESQVAIWANGAISKVNAWWPLIIPMFDEKKLSFDLNIMMDYEELINRNLANGTISQAPTQSIIDAQQAKYKAVNETFLRRLFVPYMTYYIKVNDAAKYEYLDRYQEWLEDLKKLKSTYGKMIDPKFKLDSLDIDGDGKADDFNGQVAFTKEVEYTYSDTNTWASNNFEVGNASSRSKFGK